MALEPPNRALPLPGLVLHGLRAGLPVLGHRPPARAAVAGRHAGHAGARRARAALRLEPAPSAPPSGPLACLARPHAGFRADPEYAGLELDAEARGRLRRRGPSSCSTTYFRLEDPTTITPIGIELKLEVELGGLNLRGIIDRLELDADGELVVTDYKTGRAPASATSRGASAASHFYSLLCERLFGAAPGEGPAALPGRPAWPSSP